MHVPLKFPKTISTTVEQVDPSHMHIPMLGKTHFNIQFGPFMTLSLYIALL